MSYTKNVLFRDKTNRFLPFQRTLGLDERGRLFQSVGDNTGNLTSINRKADSLQGLSIRNKRDVLPSAKPGAHKNTASTDVWAVQRVIAAMSGSLSTQQLAELLPANSSYSAWSVPLSTARSMTLPNSSKQTSLLTHSVAEPLSRYTS